MTKFFNRERIQRVIVLTDLMKEARFDHTKTLARRDADMQEYMDEINARGFYDKSYTVQEYIDTGFVN